MSERIAVYWDFENIHLSLGNQIFGADWIKSSRFQKQTRIVDLPAIMQWVNSLGQVCVNRAYANWSYLSCYSTDLQNHCVDLVQLFHRGSHAKNGADIRIAVDVIEDLHRHPIDTIVIIGGDSDYIAVAQKVRERGRKIYGFGVEDTTNPYWVRACHDFRFYQDVMTPVWHNPMGQLEDQQRMLLDANHAMNDAYERYVRLLKEQQIRIVEPHLLTASIEQSWQIFEKDPMLTSFEVFRQQLKDRMQTLHHCTDTDLAKIKAILYKARFFAIDPAHPGVRRDPELHSLHDAIERVQIMLIQRVLDNIHENPHLSALQRLLPDQEHANMMQLMRQVQEPLGIPA